MNMKSSCLRIPLRLLRATAILCAILLLPGDPGLWAIPQQASGGDSQAPALTNDQLDSLVAPIALYPDQLLGQTLVASTYPLEIIQLQQWMAQNKNLKDKALADAVKKQDWDPSVQSMAMFPDVVKQLADNIKWTTDLGNAVLANQSAVMDAVQRMRTKAKDKGNLKSTEQQKVEVQTVESKQVIVIQPSNPEVIYVPSYNPTVVYGPPVYAYPPVYYPPPGYYAAGMAISFGVGLAMGAAWGGGWGWGCGWGGNNNIYINNNNNFNRNTNIQGGDRNRVNAQGGNRSNWQHNPQHRGGAPYGDRATASKYGGTARGDSLQSRQNNARQNMQRTSAGTMDRGAGNRGASAGTMDRGAGNRGASAGTMDRSAGDRGASAGTMDRGGSRGSSGGDRVGDRSVPSGRSNSAFGSGGGYSGSSARASSSRGSSSFGGGGSRGGGSRGGGGRRR